MSVMNTVRPRIAMAARVSFARSSTALAQADEKHAFSPRLVCANPQRIRPNSQRISAAEDGKRARGNGGANALGIRAWISKREGRGETAQGRTITPGCAITETTVTFEENGM